MNYKQHLKKKSSFLNKRGEYDRFLFKNRSTDNTVKSQAERVLELPPQLGQYHYDVQQGVQTASQGRSRVRIVILATCCALSLMWWLSTNSRAYYEDLPNILSSGGTPADALRGLGLSEGESLDALPTPDSFVELLESPSERFSDVDPELDIETDTALLDPINGVLLDDNAEAEFSPWLNVSVGSGDTLSTIFERHALNKTQLYQLLASGEYSKRLERLRPDQTLRIKRDEEGNLEDIILVLDFEQELHIFRKDGQFEQEIRQREIDNRLVYVHGCVESSLYIDGQAAGLMNHQVLELKNIFRNDFGLRNLQKGDHFSVVFQEYTFEGEKETGDILAAEFVHDGKTYQAVRLTDNNGQRAEYYNPTKQGQEAFGKLTGQLNNKCEVRQSALANEAAPVTLGKTKLAWQADPDSKQSVFVNTDDETETDLLSWIQPDIDKPKQPKPEPVVIVAEKPKAPKKSNNNRAATNTKNTEKKRTAKADPNRGNRQTQPKLVSRPAREWSPVDPLPSDRASIVLASAHSLLGTPYKYGGTSPSTGFDCSGFVLYNMRKAGVKVPRTAREQFARTTPVSRANLKPGDLVFFRVRHRYVDHVGIYIGNDEFIHAESSRKPVTITSLSNPFYRKYFVGGGRSGG